MATNAAVIINAKTGQPLMVVVPDNDEELKDKAYNPPGAIQILVPMDTYQISSHDQLKSVIDTVVTSLGIVKPDIGV